MWILNYLPLFVNIGSCFASVCSANAVVISLEDSASARLSAFFLALSFFVLVFEEKKKKKKKKKEQEFLKLDS